ncbi:DivIVA domain-containing protein [Saccharomonospora iraqiensis]|uniref:DivIVA domain-containing protein n=1 Tax=Saccharomonospora iraqiensis TaxID=52698 RepID=UPI00022E5A3C|nr:DivIVA domain-containing protein [Saccharomonospora iraqiensis]
MSLTADEVAGIEFGDAPLGRRGYSKTEVDAFVRRVARALAGADDLTAAEVHHVRFSRPLLGRRGYDEREVDEFLDAVEEQLLAVPRPRSGHRADDVDRDPAVPQEPAGPDHGAGPDHTAGRPTARGHR